MDAHGTAPDRPPGLFAYLTEPDWRQLRSLGTRRAFAAGDQLFRQGDGAGLVYLIVDGAVKVIRSEPAGKQTILTIRSVGDVIGDMSALDGQPRSASVAAITRLGCQAIAGPVFRHFVDQPTVASAFARYTATRLREADVQRTELAVLPVRQRLARALLRLHEAVDHDQRLDLPQQDLAELVGASRNAVVLALGVLRAEGILDTQRRRVAIRDPGGLRHAADHRV